MIKSILIKFQKLKIFLTFMRYIINDKLIKIDNILKMNKFFSRTLWSFAIFASIFGVSTAAYAQSVTDLLGGVLGNVAQGVFSSSNLSVSDIAGEWTASGSAISFQGDNFLKKAGGLAAAGAIESKLDPYYKKLGLNNAVLTVNSDGNFKLKIKGISLSGTAESNGDGTFYFNFKAFGSFSLGKVKTYVQKSGNNLDVMFDAKKLKTLISGVAKLTGISVAKTISSVLDSYEGLCVGFKMSKTGSVNSQGSESGASDISSGVNNILNKISGNSSSNSNTNSNNTQSTNKNSSEENNSPSASQVGESLMNILKGAKK